MISEITGKVKGVFGVRSASEESASGSNTIWEETMADSVKDGIAQSVGPNITNVVHCGGRSNIDAIPSGKSTVIIQDKRRRFSEKSDSMDSQSSVIAQAEDDIVNFGAEDTVFIIKGGLIEGQVTVKEIAEAINDVTRKDDANETAAMFAKMGYGRRRSSVLRDKELESAAAELGDRII